MKRSIRGAWVFGCGLGLLGVRAWTPAQPPVAGPQRGPAVYNDMARAAVTTPLEMQARNGLVLEHTVWNHHFQVGDDKLLRSGMALLDRLGRRKHEPVVEIFLQSARDVRFTAGQGGKYVTQRSTLDVKRAQAIQEYLEASQPHVAFVVRIHDPGTPDIPGTEALQAYKLMLAGTRGLLPPELQQTLAASIRVSTGKEPPPPLPTATQGTGPANSSLGPEAAMQATTPAANPVDGQE